MLDRITHEMYQAFRTIRANRIRRDSCSAVAELPREQDRLLSHPDCYAALRKPKGALHCHSGLPIGACYRLDRVGHRLDIQLTHPATTAALLDRVAQCLAYLSRIHHTGYLQSMATCGRIA